MSDPLKQELLELSDKFYNRFVARLEGLTDEEYFWEPAPDAWTLSPDDNGRFTAQWGYLFDEPAPVTTIAWRYAHISDLLCEERCATWFGLEPEPEDLFADGMPPDVVTARELFEKSFARWKRYLSAVDTATWFDEIGPISPGFSDAPRLRFALHILDEVIHHGAEVGVLRDIYRAQRGHDEAVSMLLRGERPSADEIERVKREHPALLLRAAAYTNFHAVPLLLELGFAVDGREGRTPLHHAAAHGRFDIIRLLIDAGADLEARDPVYKAKPHRWASFFGHEDVAQMLRNAERS